MDRRVHDLLLGRRKLLDDLALTGDQDAVGQGHDLRPIGGDHDHRLAVVGEPVDQLVDLDDGVDVSG
jgi:hypothetical protein